MPDVMTIRRRKRDRQALVRRLVAQGKATDQEAVRRLLQISGFSATQPTVARDLDALGLVKTATGWAEQSTPGAAERLPAFDVYDRDDVEHFMKRLRFPGTVRTAVLEAWDAGEAGDREQRKWAIRQLQETTRHGAVEDSERALNRAWNYYLGNELYLPDAISQKANEAFQPLRKTLTLAQTPGATGDYLGWRQEASDRVTELKNLLRTELRVVDVETSGTTVTVK